MNILLKNSMSCCFRNFIRLLVVLLIATVPVVVTAQVTTLSDWTSLYNGSSSPGNLTYTIPTGSDNYRLLVVAVATTRSTTGSRTVAVTYGGQTLTAVNGDLSNSTRQHTQLYYLDEAGLDAATNNTLSVAISTGTTTRNVVFASVYDDVDQVNPIIDSGNYSSGTNNVTTFSFSQGITVNASDKAVKVLCSVRSSSSARSINNFGTDWTIDVNLQNNPLRNAVGNRAIPAASVTDASTTTMSGSSLISMTGMSMGARKYFRSVQSGNWNSTSTWEESTDSITWVAAASVPTFGHKTTTIISGHTVTLSANASASSLTVDGILNTGTYTLSGTNNLIALSNGVINVSGTSNFPSSGFTAITLNSGSTVNYNMAGNQNIYATSYSNLTISGTSGTKTLLGETTVNGNLTISRPLATNNYQLTVGGNFTQNNTFTQGTGTVILNGSTTQTISGSSATTFYNLTVNKSGGEVTLSKAITVSNVLSLQSGIVNTTASNLLTITNTSTSALTGGSATSYVSGPLLRYLPASLSSGTSYNFPVGKSGSYYPFTLVNPVTGTGTITTLVEANTGDPGGSAAAPLLSKSTTEYWALTTTGNFTNSSISIARPTDITPYNSAAGSPTQTGTYNSLFGTIGQKGITNSDAIGTNRFFTFGKTNSIVYTSVPSVSGFTYPEGYGPSNILSFDVSGSYLSSNVTLQPTTNFEISSLGGGAFTPAAVVTLPVVSNTLNPTPVYVRLKSGLAISSYSDTLHVVSAGAVTKTVIVNGTVTTPPYINLSTSYLSAFSYKFGQGPSGYQSFTVSGGNLEGNVVLTAPSAYEISTSSGSGYSSSVSLSPTGNSLNPTTIYVRMKIGLGVGTHVQNIQVNSSHATTKTLSCSGTVNPTATIYNSRSLLPAFIYTTGTGPSGTQTFEVKGTNLVGNITATAPTNFQVSLNGSTWGSSVTLTQSGGTVNLTTIYVRMSSGLSTGTYGPSALTITSTDAIPKSVACSGRVVASGSPTIMSSTTAMNGFGYQAASGGPSTEQFIVVSGASLTGNLIVTPPTNYEISTSQNSGYQSSALPLTPSNGRVNPTIIYIRLKSSLSANNYNETIAVTSSGATAINVSLIGKVYVSPLITAGGGGTYCLGETIPLTSTGDDILNRYWEGPNGFYSLLQNPTLTNASASMSGTYSVTGNVVVGGNLIYNGDFENGNVGFGSGYDYAGTGSNALYPEATYTVIANPSLVHGNFSPCNDHTPSPGTQQMVINGSPIAGVIVWSQSVSVLPGADYEFSYWIQSVVAENPSQLQLYVNGVAAGPVYTANLTTCSIKQFIYNTSAGSNTILNLELINQNTVTSGNDFALDDIEFKQVLFATDSVQVLATPSVAVGVSITASANPVLDGTPVTFTATPVNPGTSPVYQWFLNGNPVGTNSPTFTSSTLSNQDKITCRLTSSITCVTNNPATSGMITMTIIPNTNYWHGTNSTSWADPANWTGGYVPAAGENVEYATSANNSGSPAVNDLVLDADRTIGSLINLTEKIIVIPEGKTLIINGSISTNGQNRIYIKAGEGVANGSLIFPNETNPVYGIVEMWSKAYIDDECDCGNDMYKWQFFGPPIHSIVAEPTFSGSAVRIYDESKQTIEEGKQWTSLTNVSVLEKFKGYEITQPVPKKIVFVGRLVNDNLSTGELAVTEGSYYKGWHLLSNPYTAAISVKDIVFGSGMEQTVYLYTTGSFNDWRNNAGNHGTVSVWNDVDSVAPGQYLAIPKNIAGFTPATAVIPSMQGFMVGVSNRETPPPTGKTVNFAYGNLTANTRPQRANEIESQASSYVYSVVTIAGGDKFDRVWLFTDEQCTPSFDNGWDGRKIVAPAGSTLQLYASQAKDNFQIHATNNINDTYLTVRPVKGQEVYTLHFRHKNTEVAYEQIKLVDLQTGTVVDVTADGSTYTFITNEKDVANRFKLIATPLENGEREDIGIFVDSQRLFIHNHRGESGLLHLYNLSGQMLLSLPFDASNVTAIPVEFPKGMYLVKVETGNYKVTLKAIVR
ncbi:MAG: T9SS type A sorting domain-containing protein [Paludibacter sp.]|nr:T9SS type A sorting domain-containing protein [Paludibacter sp.]